MTAGVQYVCHYSPVAPIYPIYFGFLLYIVWLHFCQSLFGKTNCLVKLSKIGTTVTTVLKRDVIASFIS